MEQDKTQNPQILPFKPRNKPENPPVIELQGENGLSDWLKSEQAKGNLPPGTTFKVIR